MVRLQRSAEVKPGRYKEAMIFALRVLDHVAKHHGITGEIFTVRFGAPVGRIIWQMDFPNFAAIEAHERALKTDREYYRLLADVTDVFIEGSVNDLLMLPFTADDPVVTS